MEPGLLDCSNRPIRMLLISAGQVGWRWRRVGVRAAGRAGGRTASWGGTGGPAGGPAAEGSGTQHAFTPSAGESHQFETK